MAEKWPGTWPDIQKITRFQLSDFLPCHFAAILGPPPKNWLPAISPAIFRPFLVLGRFPILSQASQVAIRRANPIRFVRFPAVPLPVLLVLAFLHLTFPAVSCRSREEKNIHNHHRKKIFWRTFLAPKKNFPGRWWIQKPYKTLENHIHHRNLSSVDPIFFCKEKFCTGAGWCMVSCSQRRVSFCTTSFAFGSHFLYHRFGKSDFYSSQKQNETLKLYHRRARNCTTSRVPFLLPNSGTIADSLGGTISDFLLTLCFHILGGKMSDFLLAPCFHIYGTSCVSFCFLLIESPSGHIGGTVSGFLKCGCFKF